MVLKCCIIVSSNSIFLIKCSGEKPEGVDADNIVDRIVSRRDMATQMSPGGSTHSSSPSTNPVLEPQSDHPAQLEIREVQVDKRATVIRWSKSPGSRRIKSGQPDVVEFNPNAADAQSSSWDISEEVSNFSKYVPFPSFCFVPSSLEQTKFFRIRARNINLETTPLPAHYGLESRPLTPNIYLVHKQLITKLDLTIGFYCIVKIYHEIYSIVGDQVKLTMEAVLFQISIEFSSENICTFLSF